MVIKETRSHDMTSMIYHIYTYIKTNTICYNNYDKQFII